MKKIVVLGAGESGIGAALLAKKKKYKVFVSDNSFIKKIYRQVLIKEKIQFEERGHTDMVLEGDEIIKSPGIPNNSPFIKKLKSLGKKIISDLDFAYRYINSPIIAITGTNGKSTTIALLKHIFTKASYKVYFGGNFGNSLCYEILKKEYPVNSQKKTKEKGASSDRNLKKPIYLVEVSSYQLEDIKEFRPHIAMILNIEPDHLDRYDNDITKYTKAKLRIFDDLTSGDHSIYPSENKSIASYLSSRSINKHPITTKIDFANFELISDLSKSKVNIDDLYLKGFHNLLNAKFASKAAYILKIELDIIKNAVRSFKGLSHRMEFVSKINGITFYNDSKSTNIT